MSIMAVFSKNEIVIWEDGRKEIAASVKQSAVVVRDGRRQLLIHGIETKRLMKA